MQHKIRIARTVIPAVTGDSLAVIQFFAVDFPGDGAEVPQNPALAVELLLGFLAQLFLRNDSCHAHPLLSHGIPEV